MPGPIADTAAPSSGLILLQQTEAFPPPRLSSMNSDFLPTLPPLPIRLSRRQLVALLADIKPVACASLTITTLSPCPPWMERDHRFDDYHQWLFTFCRRLRDIADSSDQPRYRFSLNWYEAGMCELAVRTAARIRPSSPASAIPKTPENTALRKQLIRRFENHRRRAYRRLQSDVGKQVAKEMADDCAVYHKQLRVKLIHPARKPSRYILQYKEPFLGRLTALAVAGLQDAGVKDPPVKEVRRIICRCLQYSRRGREYMGIPELARNENLARSYFPAVILHCWEKSQTSTSHIQIGGQGNEQSNRSH